MTRDEREQARELLLSLQGYRGGDSMAVLDRRADERSVSRLLRAVRVAGLREAADLSRCGFATTARERILEHADEVEGES